MYPLGSNELREDFRKLFPGSFYFLLSILLKVSVDGVLQISQVELDHGIQPMIEIDTRRLQNATEELFLSVSGRSND